MQRLTLKQQKFVEEYLRSGNATQAAVEAGYSPRTARSIASENLAKPAIQEALRIRQAAHVEHVKTRAEQYLLELQRICETDIVSMFDENDRLRHPSQWDPSIYAIVEEVKIRQRKNGKQSVGIKFADRHKFLEMIGNALGAFTRTRYRKRKRLSQ